MYIGYIYRHWIINDKNKEKSYIGQVHSNTEDYDRHPSKRWGTNGGNYLKENTDFRKAIEKYGWDSFHHDILLKIKCETLDELMFWLDEWECYYIWHYNSYKKGYNMTLGGHGTRGYAMYGEDNPMYGKKGELAPCYGRCGELHPLYGKKGELAPFYGHPHTEDVKKEIGRKCSARQVGGNNPKARAVICINTQQVFETIQEAINWCNEGGHIGDCCKGGNKKAGYHPITNEPLVWMFLDEWDKLEDSEKINKINFKYEVDKRVICVETGIIYKNVKAAEDVLPYCIRKCCDGKRDTAGGLHYMYYGIFRKNNNID